MSAVFAGISVEAARRAVTACLQAAMVETPSVDARILVGAVLELDLTGVITSASRILDAAEAERLDDLVQRRIAGWPVARLTGVREFWGLPLRLSADTLVPRPDTETLVEAALKRIGPRRHQPLRIADLGTGSGAILLALLSELPEAFGVGTDISVAALTSAHANARDLGFAARTTFVACDYAAALADGFDLIVSNPPYIASGEIQDLAIEVRDHDPIRALDGGCDGLDAYRRLLPEAMARLAPEGLLGLEVGHDQADQVLALMAQAGLTNLAPTQDIHGISRALFGQKQAFAGI